MSLPYNHYGQVSKGLISELESHKYGRGWAQRLLRVKSTGELLVPMSATVHRVLWNSEGIRERHVETNEEDVGFNVMHNVASVDPATFKRTTSTISILIIGKKPTSVFRKNDHLLTESSHYRILKCEGAPEESLLHFYSHHNSQNMLVYYRQDLI